MTGQHQLTLHEVDEEHGLMMSRMNANDQDDGYELMRKDCEVSPFLRSFSCSLYRYPSSSANWLKA